MKPKVSVIVPVYNVAGALPRCMESLRMQKLSDLQIICVDNCSTDDSGELLKMAVLRDPRIEIYKTKKHISLGAAYNFGMKYATGDYIGFVNPEDAQEENWFEKLFNSAFRANAHVVIGNVKQICLNGKVKVVPNKCIPSSLFSMPVTQGIFFAEFLKATHAEFADTDVVCDTPFMSKLMCSAYKPLLVDSVYNVQTEKPMMMSGVVESKQIDDIMDLYTKFVEALNADKDVSNNTEAYTVAIGERVSYLCNRFYYGVSDINDRIKLINFMMELWRKIRMPGIAIINDEPLVELLNRGDGQQLMDYMFQRMTNMIYRYKMFGIPFMRVEEKYRTRTTYLFGIPIVRRKLALGAPSVLDEK